MVLLASFRTAFSRLEGMVLHHVVEVVVGNTLHQKHAMHGHIAHIPVVQPPLSRVFHLGVSGGFGGTPNIASNGIKAIITCGKKERHNVNMWLKCGGHAS